MSEIEKALIANIELLRDKLKAAESAIDRVRGIKLKDLERYHYWNGEGYTTDLVAVHRLLTERMEGK